MRSRSDRREPGAVALDVLSWPDHRAHILARYRTLLAEEHSPLLHAGPEVETQLVAQLFAVVDEAAGERADAPGGDLSSRIGQDRATSSIHASVSLAAARLIFVAALPSLTRHLEDHGDPAAATSAAIRLNAAILDQMAHAAESYVGYLLDKADRAHRDEAQRLSRDLHDAVGPHLAVAVQSLDLAARHRTTDPERADAKLLLARGMLVEASAALRGLAAETRVDVEPGGLAAALGDYLDHLPDHCRGTVSSYGALDEVPAHYEREVYLVLREAVRNAVAHSAATEIAVRLDVEGTRLIGSVRDDGGGFAPGETDAGTGLASMRERAALLGARLEVDSSAAGTQVVLTVPLPQGAAS